jgi:hypothetical protein
MAEKKCKSCAMMIPNEAKTCPYCRKRQGWALPAKIFAALFIVGAFGAAMNSLLHHESIRQQATSSQAVNTNNQRNQAGLGNNIEAKGFAKSMTNVARETWPKGNVTWHLELTPKKNKWDQHSYLSEKCFIL